MKLLKQNECIKWHCPICKREQMFRIWIVVPKKNVYQMSIICTTCSHAMILDVDEYRKVEKGE